MVPEHIISSKILSKSIWKKYLLLDLSRKFVKHRISSSDAEAACPDELLIDSAKMLTLTNIQYTRDLYPHSLSLSHLYTDLLSLDTVGSIFLIATLLRINTPTITSKM